MKMERQTPKPVPSKGVGAQLSEAGLYVAAEKVYPQAVKGRFRTLKTRLAWGLLVVSALVPWIRWDRGPGVPDQAVLFSFPHMRAYFFDTVIWAQEFYFLTAILITATLGLFLATALFGRVWCGFACPQTVWTDLFVWIERLVEGDRNARIKLDKAPWSAAKLGRKAVKHGLWAVVSALTGFLFVAFFTDAPSAARDLPTGEASTTLYGFWGLFAAFTYLMAGWVREQMCIYMCPWPRIQGGMLDDQTLIVSYDRGRGENRAHARVGQSFADRGHCVDCAMCARVCPTGIDIRNGPQLACIGCGLCADACNRVMDRFGLPHGLVGWAPPASGRDGARARPGMPHPGMPHPGMPHPDVVRPNIVKPKLLRPRTIAYGVLILLTVGASAVAAGHRTMMALSILPDRAPTFVRLSDGSVRNGYTVKLVNRDRVPVEGVLSVDGLDGGVLSVVGTDGESATRSLTADAGSVTTYRVFLRQPAASRGGERTDIGFTFRADRDATVAEGRSVFITGDGRRP